MEFFETHGVHLTGLLIGIFTFVIIGAFHPIVIKAEYYFGVRCWWCFLVAGAAGALCIANVLWSSVVGVFAFSSFWAIKELFDQRERVRKGWFPRREKEGGKS
ncbi:MAG: DUF4491 family protein [Odoribacteraceae bacterium]|jgi:hypothetical protein|nr:DUF4491 family protein [Odoribacteraceae bacterium]